MVEHTENDIKYNVCLICHQIVRASISAGVSTPFKRHFNNQHQDYIESEKLNNKKDKEESKLWDKYMQMYEEVLVNCNATPWVIVPADQNWYKEYIIAKTLFDTLKGLDMHYPELEEKN